MIDRMTRASQLSIQVYEEVEHNPRLNMEAFSVVAFVSGLAALGVLLSYLFRDIGSGIGIGIGTVILGVLQWYLWSFITLLVGTKGFGGTANFGEVSRTLAYASGPNALGVFAWVPVLGWVLTLVGSIWTAVTGVVAIRQAMDFDSGKAIATVIISWVISLIPMMILRSIVM